MTLVYVIVLGILAARLLVREVISTTRTEGTSGPRPFDLAFRPRTARTEGTSRPRAFDLAFRPRTPRTVDTPSDPRRIAFELRSSLDVPSTLHVRLRPRLRAIAADRLVADHGVSLDRDPEASRSLLGDEAWELLRADREPPARRQGSAISTPQLERIVSAVERL
jgi:hypothetical protein